MVTEQQEREFLSRKKRIKDFYSSTKLKGVRRTMNNNEWFESLFDKV